jgi:predicted metal-binding membrane protein
MATEAVPAQAQRAAAENFAVCVARPARRPGLIRPLVILGLVVLAGLAWGCLLLYPLQLAPQEMARVAGTAVVTQAASLPFGPGDALLAFAMWVVTVTAVLLPATAPLVLLFATVSRLHHLVRFPGLATVVFVIGNLFAWIGFALLAALAQWALHDTGALDSGMALANTTAAGLLLVAAGAWQWTPGKHGSLEHCRSPLSFVLAGWRPGFAGALRMGVGHGLHAIGCCWALMLLLFATGVMSLPAIAAIAALLAGEKLLPGGAVLACVGGLALVALGTYVLFP